MRVLVTGGAGYIGSHTCVELLNEGHEVVVVDNFCNSQLESIRLVEKITGKSVKFYKADVRNEAELDLIFTENIIDAVIHFAGLKAVGESVEKPMEYYHNNILSTLVLCQVMKKYGVKRLVFSSSATVYGIHNVSPYVEDMPLSATNPYGWSKLMMEQILSDICVSDSEWRVALLRYFNPIGAHESGLIGENPNGIPNNLMPFITQVAVGIREKLNVFGDDFETHDGTGVRDYIHVVDLAMGHLKALEKLDELNGTEAFNLGTGVGYSVLDVVKTFENQSGVQIPYQVLDRRAGDIASYFSNPEKAKVRLDWQATKGLDDMCRDSWRWQCQNPRGYE
ncbi:MAG: lnpD [Bacillales bacterium]|jgi:UDP-glucose 4-epimerase|nr:lnpD [Bacillales bacterium]